MQFSRHFLQFFIPLAAIFIWSSFLSAANPDKASGSSIYDVLKDYRLPMGLFPNGVKDFSLDNSGKFEVHLDRACYTTFENSLHNLHYDMNVSGTLRLGQIDGLSGISAQDLFLWFPVIDIRVDTPSSGVIYFDMGVVSKQFSLSYFESPRDCVAAPGVDLQDGRQIVETVSKQIRLVKNDNAERKEM